MKQVNLLLSFLLELCLVAGLSIVGYRLGGDHKSIELGLAVLLPLIMIVMWSRWAAPRAAHRLSGLKLFGLKCALFFIGSGLLIITGKPAYGIVLFGVSVVNLGLATKWKQ